MALREQRVLSTKFRQVGCDRETSGACVAISACTCSGRYMFWESVVCDLLRSLRWPIVSLPRREPRFRPQCTCPACCSPCNILGGCIIQKSCSTAIVLCRVLGLYQRRGLRLRRGDQQRLLGAPHAPQPPGPVSRHIKARSQLPFRGKAATAMLTAELCMVMMSTS